MTYSAIGASIPVELERNPAKAEANLQKRGVSSDEAVELLAGDANYLEIGDDAHDEDWIISVREATRRETRLFEEHGKASHE